MRTQRLFLPGTLKTGQAVKFNDETAHYVRSVLRLKSGAPIVIFNGEGGEFAAQLVEVGRHAVVASIGEWKQREAESSLQIELALGVSRAERMDFSVQKAVELGVTKISPLLTARCVVKLAEGRMQQKQRHWQRVAQSASEQSGRNRVPEVAQPVVMGGGWLTNIRGVKLLLDPTAKQPLGQIQLRHIQICLLSGPEGGFDTHERAAAKAAGFIPVRLGPRILRTETAVLAAIAAVQALWGDFR